jgi:superoxide dismutase
MFDINKIQTEFDKEKKGLEAKNKATLDAMKTCPNCKETDTKFTPCQAHMDELKAIGDAMGKLQLHTQLKVQMHPQEMQKIVEAQTKAMQAEMQKQFGKKGKPDKSCSTCCPHA